MPAARLNAAAAAAQAPPAGPAPAPPSIPAVRARILELARRARGSICPSAVARSFFAARAQWAPLMPLVRSVAAALIASGRDGAGADAGRLVCTQRGVVVGDPREARGPIRLKWERDAA